jgi:ribonuclease III
MTNNLKPLLKYLENNYQIKVSNKKHYQKAFIHRSYINEINKEDLNHNERIEFLGDAVIELAVTDYIFSNYPNKGEGELTNWRAALVRGSNLARAARKLDLGQYLKLSKGEERSGGRSKEVILAGTFEALVGAIYLDQGYKKAEQFIKSEVIDYLKEIIAEGGHIDSKTYFQEAAQEKYEVTPTYEVVSESGPDHKKEFKISVYLEDRKVGTGTGSSKQKGQQAAAKDAIKNLKLNDQE